MNNILFILYLSISLFFIVKIYQKNIYLKNTVRHLKWDINTLKQDKELKSNDDFIRFLDQSRELAFDYIQNAQEVILSVKDRILNNKLTKKEIKDILLLLNTLLPEDENAKR